MEHCRSPDGATSVSVRPYYTMLSRVYLALAMGFLVKIGTKKKEEEVILTVLRLLASEDSSRVELN